MHTVNSGFIAEYLSLKNQLQYVKKCLLGQAYELFQNSIPALIRNKRVFNSSE